MDLNGVTTSLLEAIVPILVFLSLLVFVMIRGRRALTSLILGLYFALLWSLTFPYYDKIFSWVSDGLIPDSVLTVLIFVGFTATGLFLFDKLLFHRPDETAFQAMNKKIVLAILGTILVMAFSYHVLPIANLVESASPINTIFSAPEYFFWWLIIPIIGLFLLY